MVYNEHLKKIFAFFYLFHRLAIDISFSVVCLHLFFCELLAIKIKWPVILLCFGGTLFVYNLDQFLDTTKNKLYFPNQVKAHLIVLCASLLITSGSFVFLLIDRGELLRHHCQLLLLASGLIFFYFLSLSWSRFYFFKELAIGFLFVFFIIVFCLLQVENQNDFDKFKSQFSENLNFYLMYGHFTALVIFIIYLFSFFHIKKDQQTSQPSIMILGATLLEALLTKNNFAENKFSAVSRHEANYFFFTVGLILFSGMGTILILVAVWLNTAFSGVFNEYFYYAIFLIGFYLILLFFYYWQQISSPVDSPPNLSSKTAKNFRQRTVSISSLTISSKANVFAKKNTLPVFCLWGDWGFAIVYLFFKIVDFYIR